MIVVTGGAGFIGSHLLADLEARGLPAVLCDRLGQDEKWRNIAKRAPLAIIPPEALLDWLAEQGDAVEIIFHLGAISSTLERDADLVLRENVALPFALWRHCAARGIRFVYASSAATYGDGTAGFEDRADSASLAALRPLNPYGWSKHLFDRMAIREVEAGRPTPPQWAGLKFFNVYGPHEAHKAGMQSLVSRLHPQLASGAPARLFRSYRPDYPDGGQKRDFVYVGDCVAAMLWLYDNPQVNGLFNLGSGQARSWLDLAHAAFAALGRAAAIEFVDMPDALRGHYQYFTEAPMSRLREAGFARAFTSLEDGVRQTYELLGKPDPYR